MTEINKLAHKLNVDGNLPSIGPRQGHTMRRISGILGRCSRMTYAMLMKIDSQSS